MSTNNKNKITPTEKQEKAIELAVEWMESDEKYERPFVLQGFAGTGKSATIEFIKDKLDLSASNVKYAAYTGLAATNLIRRGLSASTIHKLIYDPIPLKNGQVIFELKDYLPSEIELIIVDEFSMVDSKMMEDLESFDRPIIIVGDPYQLPAIGGKPNEYMDKPDIVLDEVMRQALDNPIIQIATKARLGEPIEYGTYTDGVEVISKDQLDLSDLVAADQILCNTNKEIDRVTKVIREDYYGLDSPFPHAGEKLLCLKNNWSESLVVDSTNHYLVNGTLGIANNFSDYNPNLESFQFDFAPIYLEDTGQEFTDIFADGIYFSENIKTDSGLFDKDDPLYEKYKKTMIKREAGKTTSDINIDKFTFGYALTVYKAQGSQWKNIVYTGDPTSSKIRQKSNYVAATRAEEGLIYVQ